MKMIRNRLTKLACFSLFFASSATSFAATVPGSTDAGRVLQDEQNKLKSETKETKFAAPKASPVTKIPESIKAISFELKAVNIEGMSVFQNGEFESLYANELNKQVSLAIAWTIADEITKKYRDAGYFLSRAYVPEQKIKDGVIHIRVVEGYVSAVELPKEIENSSIVQHYLADFLKNKPTNMKTLRGSQTSHLQGSWRTVSY